MNFDLINPSIHGSLAMGNGLLRWPDLLVLGLEFAVLVVIGCLCSRRGKSAEGYFLAGRSMPGWTLGFSLMATIVSSMSFLALPAFAFEHNWRHFPGRKKILPLGEDSWELGMILAHSQVIENGDEWWIYYRDMNDYHNEWEQKSAISLAKFRKEAFVSIRAKENESYIVTRPIIRPGGELIINADVHSRGGFVRARVTEDDRTTVFDGLGFNDCITFKGDNIRHCIKWKKAKMSGLKGEMLRLEFEFKNADIYTFLVEKYK